MYVPTWISEEYTLQSQNKLTYEVLWVTVYALLFILLSSSFQITENAVEILDDISDWPADVVEEQSAMYVIQANPYNCLYVMSSHTVFLGW